MKQTLEEKHLRLTEMLKIDYPKWSFTNPTKEFQIFRDHGSLNINGTKLSFVLVIPNSKFHGRKISTALNARTATYVILNPSCNIERLLDFSHSFFKHNYKNSDYKLNYNEIEMIYDICISAIYKRNKNTIFDYHIKKELERNKKQEEI